jgi:hypothetical protein
MGDAELILRFFAFYFDAAEYKGYFATFLDNYLRSGAHMSESDLKTHESLFLETIEKVVSVFGNFAFRRFDREGKPEGQVNRAIYDVIMLTFARIDRESLYSHREQIVDALRKLSRTDQDFIDAIGQATRDKKRINTRVRRWVESLRSIGIDCPDLVFGD